MSENNESVVLKRICIFFIGLVIGLVAGHKHGENEMKERIHDRVMKKAERPVRRNIMLKPREESFFERREETPKERVPR